jgi:hypothetical protein
MNTDTKTITDGVLAVDYGKALADMISAGKYEWKNSDITAARFPVEGTGTKNFRTKLFHFGRHISSEDAVAAMETENFMPATHVHGLAFGATFPDEQRKYPIACLGSYAWVSGHRYVVCLSRVGGVRYLDLCDWYGGWVGRWRFLGVQEVSDT